MPSGEKRLGALATGATPPSTAEDRSRCGGADPSGKASTTTEVAVAAGLSGADVGIAADAPSTHASPASTADRGIGRPGVTWAIKAGMPTARRPAAKIPVRIRGRRNPGRLNVTATIPNRVVMDRCGCLVTLNADRLPPSSVSSVDRPSAAHATRWGTGVNHLAGYTNESREGVGSATQDRTRSPLSVATQGLCHRQFRRHHSGRHPPEYRPSCPAKGTPHPRAASRPQLGGLRPPGRSYDDPVADPPMSPAERASALARMLSPNSRASSGLSTSTSSRFVATTNSTPSRGRWQLPRLQRRWRSLQPGSVVRFSTRMGSRQRECSPPQTTSWPWR